jgi:uncharacterized protein DUF4386
MISRKTAAHRAGALYFAFMIIAIVGEFLFPAFVVPGDAAATARNITAGEPTYRLSILTGIATLVIFIFLVSSLYDLFKDVDRKQARLMVLLVSVGVAVALANVFSRLAPLVLLSGAEYLKALPTAHLEALALASLGLHTSASAVVTAFWGLWLFPFGVLVIRSGFFPRVLGYLLLVAGAAYLVGSGTSLAAPAYRHTLSRVLMPLYMGEVPIIFWMLFMGARDRGEGR